MTNKIEISRELAERLTRYYPAEITGQETMQAIRIEALAALDELRSLLATNPEENEPCPQCGGSLRTWGCTCTPRWPMYKPEIAAPAVERQDPVVIDERAEFEKSVIGKAERFHPDLSKYGIDGEYKHAQLQYAWDLWQARACLGKIKEMNK